MKSFLNIPNRLRRLLGRVGLGRRGGPRSRRTAPPTAPASDLADQVKTMQLIEQIEAGAGASHA